MKENEKRFTRTYKATDTAYNKAMLKAEKEGGSLTALIEQVITAYGAGLKISAYNVSGKMMRIKSVKP